MANARLAPKPAPLGRAPQSSPGHLAARLAYPAVARTSARAPVTAPVRLHARCRTMKHSARVRPARAINIPSPLTAMAPARARPRLPRRVRAARVQPTAAARALVPARQPRAPAPNTATRPQATAQRRRGTEPATRARQGPSAHLVSAHRTVSVARRPVRANAKPVTTARELAPGWRRANRWGAVSRARTQPTLHVVGVATTRPTIVAIQVALRAVEPRPVAPRRTTGRVSLGRAIHKAPAHRQQRTALRRARPASAAAARRRSQATARQHARSMDNAKADTVAAAPAPVATSTTTAPTVAAAASSAKTVKPATVVVAARVRAARPTVMARVVSTYSRPTLTAARHARAAIASQAIAVAEGAAPVQGSWLATAAASAGISTTVVNRAGS